MIGPDENANDGTKFKRRRNEEKKSSCGIASGTIITHRARDKKGPEEAIWELHYLGTNCHPPTLRA